MNCQNCLLCYVFAGVALNMKISKSPSQLDGSFLLKIFGLAFKTLNYLFMTCCLCFFLTFRLLVGPQSPLKKCFPIRKKEDYFFIWSLQFLDYRWHAGEGIAEGVRGFFWLIDMPVANIILTVFAWYDAITMGSKILLSRITYFMQQLFNRFLSALSPS